MRSYALGIVSTVSKYNLVLVSLESGYLSGVCSTPLKYPDSRATEARGGTVSTTLCLLLKSRDTREVCAVCRLSILEQELQVRGGTIVHLQRAINFNSFSLV